MVTQPKTASRLYIVLLILVVVPFGLAMKLYPGPGRWWVNNWGPASVAYVVCFMLAAFFFCPRASAVTWIAVAICTATCLLEFLQLWKPVWLQGIRSTFLGAILLGTSFSWWDFPAYIVGAVCGWFILRALVPAPSRGSEA